MNISKVLLGGLAGGVAFFCLGWVIYGMLLMDFMAANCNTSMNRPESDFMWWAVILANLLLGIGYAVIFEWANIRTVGAGLKAGAILGAIFTASIAFSYYSMTTMYSNLTAVVLDVAASTVMSSLGCALIAWVMGRNTTPPTTAPAP